MKLVPLLGAFALGVMVAAPAVASEEIIKKARCVACHAVDQKRIGPAYKEVAAKYKGQADAVAVLALDLHVAADLLPQLLEPAPGLAGGQVLGEQRLLVVQAQLDAGFQCRQGRADGGGRHVQPPGGGGD